jgi:glycosyltransferase involved in cell wall biosynthesis
MSNRPESPVIAVLVPLFGHSVLVVDALLAALEQVSRYPFVIVVVNDGCRLAESDLTVKSIVSVYPERFRYIVQPNAGLSAARNTGIDYALASFEALQAIYFLDADNAIQPRALENAYGRLLESPDASWVYPNIDMFGLERNFDYGGPYSLLRHTRDNICEAGSLVHRRVFDAGVRFDETMRLGYEDWDFWLSAIAAGFRGVHHEHFGFMYRNRAESMLSQSKRDDSEISAYMRKKHKALFDRRNLARLEVAEAPRYAIVFTDTNETLLAATGDAHAAVVMPQADFDALLWRNIVVPNWQHVPPLFIFLTRAVYQELSTAGLMPWMLFDCERALTQMNFAGVTLERAAGHRYEVRAGGRVRDCSVLALGRDLLCSVVKDADTSWIEKIQSPEAETMRIASRILTLPHRNEFAAAGIAIGGVVFAFLLRVLAWRASPYRTAAEHAWMWRDVSVPPPHALSQVVREAFGGEVVYPAIPGTGRNIGFALSIGSFGGVERVAYNVARQFAANGWRVHLFLLGRGLLEIPAEFSAVATSINFIEDDVFNAWDAGSVYQGTALPAAGSDSTHAVNRLVAALGWLDVVINSHSGALNAAAAALRRIGVKTLTYLHLLDLTPQGRSVGHSMITLAYEHAYNIVVCNSRLLMSWMHAAGIPEQKLLYVPNAPGHSIDDRTKARILTGRRRPVGKQLNVLYLGRLDRQKGIDRLAALIQRTGQMELPLTWRIIGAPVAADDTLPPALSELTEPAIFDSDSLTAAFGWADVMVLLSDFEGVPLSVLEAQRAGVVVIATDVGGVAEIIDSGRNGFLVECDCAVEEAADILNLVVNSPNLRPAIAAAAADVIDWPRATAELIQRVTALVDGEQPRIRPAAATTGALSPVMQAGP